MNLATSRPAQVQPRRVKVNWPLSLGILFVGIMIFLAWFGPALAPHNPMQENYTLEVDGKIRTPPYPPFKVEGYPLGTDRFGRDIVSRLLWGVRPTMIMVGTVALARLALGIFLGLAAGWMQGRAARFLDSLISMCLSIPVLISAMIGIYLIGIERGLLAFVVGLAWTGWAETGRMVSEQTRVLKSQTFVEAARAMGGSSQHILYRHIFRHILSMVWMLLSFEVSSVLLVSAELAFLEYYIGGGIWIEVSDFVAVNAEGLPELGQMIATALHRISEPAALLTVGSVVVIGVLGFNLLGEGLRLRFSQEWMSGGRRFRMVSPETEAWIEEHILQPVSYWLQEHRVALRWSLAALVLLVGGYFAINSLIVRRLTPAQDNTLFTIPGGHLWATERYDPFGTLNPPVSLDAEPQLLWSVTLPGGPSGGPAVSAEGIIYVAGRDGVLLALSPDGDLLWQTKLEASPVGAPALGGDGRIFVADAKGGVTAVSPDGSVLWRAQISKGREATSGPVVDALGNVFVTITDAIGAVNAQGEVLWYLPAADAYLSEPPRLSPNQTRVYLRNTAIHIEMGARLDIPIRPVETLTFADPSYFTGANGLNYYRPGHEIVGWRYEGEAIVTDAPITWEFTNQVLLLPVDQGVTRNGLAWLFYTTTWTDSNMIWMDADSRLLGKFGYARANGRLLAVGSRDEAYLCGANTATIECVCALPGQEEPLWTLSLESPNILAGGALIPGRFLLSVDGDGLYVFGSVASP